MVHLVLAEIPKKNSLDGEVGKISQLKTLLKIPTWKASIHKSTETYHKELTVIYKFKNGVPMKNLQKYVE